MTWRPDTLFNYPVIQNFPTIDKNDGTYINAKRRGHTHIHKILDVFAIISFPYNNSLDILLLLPPALNQAGWLLLCLLLLVVATFHCRCVLLVVVSPVTAWICCHYCCWTIAKVEKSFKKNPQRNSKLVSIVLLWCLVIRNNRNTWNQHTHTHSASQEFSFYLKQKIK